MQLNTNTNTTKIKNINIKYSKKREFLPVIKYYSKKKITINLDGDYKFTFFINQNVC